MGLHLNDVSSSKQDANISGISKHARHCFAGTIKWEEPEILATYSEKSKKSLQKNLLIRESLEIRRQLGERIERATSKERIKKVPGKSGGPLHQKNSILLQIHAKKDGRSDYGRGRPYQILMYHHN